MKHFILAETVDQFRQYKLASDCARETINTYIDFLKSTYQVHDLPRAILWTGADTATKQISDIPIPAYTNDYRTVFCPDLEQWQRLYLQQLEVNDSPEIRKYYETKLTDRHVLQILGHEFVHHSSLFIDDAYDQAMWFEEGMCEYISRKFFLTDIQFQEEASINMRLVEHYQRSHQIESIGSFSSSTYSGSYASIFYQYWRSFLAVNSLVDRYEENIMAIFSEYHRWFNCQSGKTLGEWFGISI